MTDPYDVGTFAANLVSRERQDSYGHPLDDFTRQGRMWEAILGIPVTAEQVALCMIAVKMSRQSHRMKLDNVVDGIGYWMTLLMISEERAERERNATPGE